MLTLRLNVKHSTFAQLMELEVWPSTASSVLMVHSSTRTTSSVIGGSTLTAPLPRISTLSMMKLLLSVRLSQEYLMLLVLMRLQLTMLLLLHLLVTTLLVLMKDLEAMRRKVAEAGGLETEETTDEEEGVKEGEETSEDESRVRKQTPNTNWKKL